MTQTISIRQYRESDFEAIHSWCVGLKPVKGLFVATTYMALVGDELASTLTLYLSNSKEICWLENFIANPVIERVIRRKASRRLVAHVTECAKILGYRRLLCMSNVEKLKSYYGTFGFERTQDQLTTLVKVL